MITRSLLAGLLLSHALSSADHALDLPPRRPTAVTGAAFAQTITGLPLEEREQRILAEVRQGNVPAFLRKLVPVTVTAGASEATYYVATDYLAIGSDNDYFLTPMTPYTAQKIADLLDCSLPTPKMVDDIYANAAIKLSPSPIPPSTAMTTVPVFLRHNETILAAVKGKPLGTLVAGHKKDVVITNRVLAVPGKVAIYGWHKTVGDPIQPLYTGHTAAWVDYSHGVRLVHRGMTVNGAAKTVDEVLGDPVLSTLLSNEGVMLRTRYDLQKFPSVTPPPPPAASAGEAIDQVMLDKGVRVVISRPEKTSGEPVLLIFYALPNGNSIEQTIGHAIKPGMDWHFDIQHLGAQTRFLRETIKDRVVVVAYLENELKSWPAWRKLYGDRQIPAILDAVRARFKGSSSREVLAGHSGGGSLILGYLNAVSTIPDCVVRIAFLDANYGYETTLHRDKLTAWIRASDEHRLVVLAYNDSVALLNGKTFVSAEGGTWGRSHLMQADLAGLFPFAEDHSPDMQRFTALNGRVRFLLKENPERKILHTVLVERNGFIESVLSGTTHERVGYTYMGDRAYSRFIRAD